MITVRREKPEDAPAVREVNRLAFGRDEEAELVDAVRDTPGVISLVATDGSVVVGHILFTPVRIVHGDRTVPAMALGPIAVRPSEQRRGIGSQLVRAGLEACKAEGHELVFVLGHPEYYPRFGFRRADSYGLYFEDTGPTPAFMVLELRPGALDGISGRVRYLPQFTRS